MALIWKCSCGATFGPSENFKLNRHIKQGKARGEEHASVYLIDIDTGEVKAKSAQAATKFGLIPHGARWHKKHPEATQPTAPPPGDTKPPDDERPLEAGESVSTSVRARFVTHEVLLDGRLLLLYDLSKQVYPQYDASVGEWLWDVVMQFYMEHSDELPLGKLFEDTIQEEKETVEVGND